MPPSSPHSSPLRRDVAALFQREKQRVLIIISENLRPEYSSPAELKRHVEMGYARGDPCVWLEGHPIPILSPCGVMQAPPTKQSARK